MACHRMSIWLAIAIVILALIIAFLCDFFGGGSISARHGAVASDDERCSKIGRDVLKRGGHAVDAAVAVAFCEGVVRPATSGIGGGGFMLIKNGTDVEVIDMREVAPGFAFKDMYHENLTTKHYGMLSIAVPGQVKGLYKAWEKYGKTPWKDLVSPSEKLARNGFVISKNLYGMMKYVKHYIMNDEGLKSVFAPDGKLLRKGDVCKNVKLADSLSKIKSGGADVFYTGTLGKDLITDIQKVGGNLTIDDLKQYKVLFRKPITTNVLGRKLLGAPPPASGAASIFLILNILDLYGFPLFNSPGLQAHRRIEALKHAFAVRMNIGDPNFVDISDVLHDMLSPNFAAELKKMIDDTRTFDPTHYGGKWNLWHLGKEDGTTHYCVVDNDRNAVSVTTTINYYFGSGFLSPNTGIILNNHMDDFSIPMACTSLNCTFADLSCTCTPVEMNSTCCEVLPPAPANFIEPYKRPLSAAAPIIVMEGERLKAVIGASGGPRIIGATTEVLLNYFVEKMKPFHSVRAPRYYDPLVPNQVRYENWTFGFTNFLVPKEIRDGLAVRGHKILSMESEPGVCQFIVQNFKRSHDGVLVAVSDPRFGGKPAGY